MKPLSSRDQFDYITNIREHFRTMMFEIAEKQRWLIGSYAATIMIAILGIGFDKFDDDLLPYLRISLSLIITAVTIITVALLNRWHELTGYYADRHAACFLLQNDLITGKQAPEHLNMNSAAVPTCSNTWIFPVCIGTALLRFRTERAKARTQAKTQKNTKRKQDANKEIEQNAVDKAQEQTRKELQGENPLYSFSLPYQITVVCAITIFVLVYIWLPELAPLITEAITTPNPPAQAF